MVGFPHRTCDCGRPPGQCVKGDLEDCPALDEEDNDDLMECPRCGGSGQLDDVLECDECWGTGQLTL